MFDFIKAGFEWFILNKEELAIFLGCLGVVAESIVRITPTKSDDAALERIGKLITKVFSILKIPSIKKPEIKNKDEK